MAILLGVGLLVNYCRFPRTAQKIGMTHPELLIDDDGITQDAPVTYCRHTWDLIRKREA